MDLLIFFAKRFNYFFYFYLFANVQNETSLSFTTLSHNVSNLSTAVYTCAICTAAVNILNVPARLITRNKHYSGLGAMLQYAWFFCQITFLMMFDTLLMILYIKDP